MTRGPQQRDISIDAVRLVGLVAIVAGHSFTGDGAREAIYSWHVPLFFFLSGYLWRTGRGFRDEVRRRTETLLIPYLFWLTVIAIVFLPIVFVNEGTSAVVRRVASLVLGGYFLNSPFQAFWFVTALFFACTVYRVLDGAGLRYSAVVVLAASVAISLIGTDLKYVPEALGIAVPALSFIALGHLARRAPQSALLGCALLLAGGVLTAAGINEPLDLKQGNFGVPLLGIVVAAGISWGLVLVARPLFLSASAVPSAAITKLSQLALAAVLTHGVVVEALLGRVPEWLVFLVALAFGFTVAWVASVSPARRWALGGALLTAETRRA